MRKIEYVVSNERLITPSGLSLVGQVLGKSKSRQKSQPYADRKALTAANQKRGHFVDHDRSAGTRKVRFRECQ